MDEIVKFDQEFVESQLSLAQQLLNDRNFAGAAGCFACLTEFLLSVGRTEYEFEILHQECSMLFCHFLHGKKEEK